MTTILPSERSPWQVLDRAIGSEISQNLPSAVRQGYQRQVGHNAIDKLQEALKQPGANIQTILPALAHAYTDNENLQRSGIAEKFVPLIQRNELSKDFPTGKFPTKKVEGKEGEESKEVPVSFTDLVTPKETIDSTQGVNKFQLPFGPEEFAEARQKAREARLLPEVEERIVNDMKEYNEAAKEKRNYDIQNYNQKEIQRQNRLENQAGFAKYLNENAPEFTKNTDEQELALKFGEGKLKDSTSYADALSQVRQELRPYQHAKKALNKSLSRPVTGWTKDQLDLNRNRAQMMVDMGQKDQLRLMIAENGHGDIEEAQLLNKLPSEIDQQLGKFRISDPFESVKSIDPESKEYNQQLQQGQERRMKQISNVEKYLSEHIIPGTYKKPGTNLLLTRKHLMDNGAGWSESGQIIDSAISKGQIKLDDHQRIDYMKLGYPPLTGDTYLDTVLNHVFSSITGKE